MNRGDTGDSGVFRDEPVTPALVPSGTLASGRSPPAFGRPVERLTAGMSRDPVLTATHSGCQPLNSLARVRDEVVLQYLHVSMVVLGLPAGASIGAINSFFGEGL